MFCTAWAWGQQASTPSLLGRLSTLDARIYFAFAWMFLVAIMAFWMSSIAMTWAKRLAADKSRTLWIAAYTRFSSALASRNAP